jgi:hypothetical protein
MNRRLLQMTFYAKLTGLAHCIEIQRNCTVVWYFCADGEAVDLCMN